MRVKVLYFAAARERTGTAHEAVELPGGATVGRLLRSLCETHPGLSAVVAHLRVAVNQEFVSVEGPLHEGDEVALIPPVAGGAGWCAVVERPLQVNEVIEAVSGPGQGGVVSFSGAVRDATRGRAVTRLEYEAYAPMAVKKLEQIVEVAMARWPGCRLAIRHRVGTLSPGELAVVIAASAPHRAEAFAACSFAIEELKREVPIWKKEVYADGEVWVGLGP